MDNAKLEPKKEGPNMLDALNDETQQPVAPANHDTPTRDRRKRGKLQLAGFSLKFLDDKMTATERFNRFRNFLFDMYHSAFGDAAGEDHITQIPHPSGCDLVLAKIELDGLTIYSAERVVSKDPDDASGVTAGWVAYDGVYNEDEKTVEGFHVDEDPTLEGHLTGILIYLLRMRTLETSNKIPCTCPKCRLKRGEITERGSAEIQISVLSDTLSQLRSGGRNSLISGVLGDILNRMSQRGGEKEGGE